MDECRRDVIQHLVLAVLVVVVVEVWHTIVIIQPELRHLIWSIKISGVVNKQCRKSIVDI